MQLQDHATRLQAQKLQAEYMAEWFEKQQLNYAGLKKFKELLKKQAAAEGSQRLKFIIR